MSEGEGARQEAGKQEVRGITSYFILQKKKEGGVETTP